jgi:hypothetical protein
VDNFLLAFLDSYGIYGSALHYSLIIAFVGSAFMIFLYLWQQGRLDMDEGPSLQMMHEEVEDDNER